MDYPQAELWCRVLNREPDKAVIAADWFDENGREDVATWLRQQNEPINQVWHTAWGGMGNQLDWLFSVCRVVN